MFLVQLTSNFSPILHFRLYLIYQRLRQCSVNNSDKSNSTNTIIAFLNKTQSNATTMFIVFLLGEIREFFLNNSMSHTQFCQQHTNFSGGPYTTWQSYITHSPLTILCKYSNNSRTNQNILIRISVLCIALDLFEDLACKMSSAVLQ